MKKDKTKENYIETKSTSFMCRLRYDLYKKDEGIELHKDFNPYYGEEKLQYRWKDEDCFQVLFAGEWCDANSINFDFENIDY